jgi:hypothetical protein
MRQPDRCGQLCDLGGNGPPPNSSALNWSAGQTLASTTVIPIGTRILFGNEDFRVLYDGPSGQADVVVDLLGYFVESTATPLQCVDATTDIMIANGVRDFTSPSCPAGFTVTGGGVMTGTNDLVFMNASAPNGRGLPR